jgi:predicted esterase
MAGATERPRVLGEMGSHSGMPIVIFLHGLGENNADRFAWMQHVAYNQRLCAFVVPQAIVRRITLYNRDMPSWFDLHDVEDRRPEYLHGYETSLVHIHKIVESLHPLGRPIILAGFSQGAAMALAAAYTLHKNPAPVWGCFAASGYSVPFNAKRAAVRTTRLMAVHGALDPVVPYGWGRKSFDSLKAIGVVNTQWVDLKSPHHSFEDESKALLLDFVNLAR